MGRKKQKVASAEIIVGVIFFLIGLGLVAGGILFTISGNRFKQTARQVTAVITDFESYTDSDGDRHHETDVSYKVNGEEYETTLSEYSSTWKIGKEITLYVNPDNPYDVRSGMGLSIVFWILFGMGVVFAGIGGLMAWLKISQNIKYKKIKANGKKFMAEVTGGNICYNYTVNNRHPYKIECKYEDTAYGQVYLFSSDYTWLDPQMYIGCQVPVYADPSKMEDYYVDLDNIQENGAAVYDFR